MVDARSDSAMALGLLTFLTSLSKSLFLTSKAEKLEDHLPGMHGSGPQYQRNLGNLFKCNIINILFSIHNAILFNTIL